MLNLNHMEVIGNLTRDPELRFTPNNQAVTSFAIATNRRYRDQANNWIDAPAEYHEIVVWAQLAERCNQVLHKGDRVYLSGRLQTRSWEAQDGSKRYKTELIADTIIGPDVVNKNMSTGESGYTHETPASSVPAASSPTPKKNASSPDEEEINIDDIPF